MPIPAAFYLDCINRAGNFRSDVFKHVNSRIVARQVSNIWHGYEYAYLALVLETRSDCDARVCDLIPFGVPNDGFGDFNPFDPLGLEVVVGNCSNNERHEPVLAVVSEVVESIKQIITAIVRIEASKERLDFRAQILTATLHTIVEVDGRFAEREGGEIRVRPACGQKECRVGGVVQTRPQMFDDFGSGHAPLDREGFPEFNLVDDMISIGIRLGDGNPRIFTKVSVEIGCECVEMFPCPLDSELPTKERIGCPRDQDLYCLFSLSVYPT
jgi:hypothetical protein